MTLSTARKVDDGQDQPCAVANVARVISEEPRLEAVAFESKTRRLSMATLGGDPGKRLARRVSEAVALPGASRCGVAAANGTCTQCGSPMDARAGGSSQRITVKQIHGNTLIEKHTCTTAVHFWRWEVLHWPKFVPRTVELPHPQEHEGEHSDDEWKTLSLQAVGCLLAGLAGLAAEHFGAPWQLALACWLAAYLSGAWEAAEETWEKIRGGELDVHFLMLAVALGAAAIGAWHEGALLLLLFSASGAMEHYAMGRTQREIGALLRGAPKTATVLDADGQEREADVAFLEPGLIVRVTGGRQIPVDLRVTRGESDCDESNLTGESRPVHKSTGDEAFGGTINLHGLLEGRVLRRANESALQKVVDLIGKAQKMRAPSQRFTDKFGTRYTYGVLGLCTVMFFVWWLGFHLPAFRVAADGTKSAFYRAMTLLVVASPCALVLSIPSAILSAIAFGARRGVLFRGGAALEALAKVDIVAMDKTGTLTAGDLQLVQVDVFRGEEAELRRMAYNLARFSDHPLSRALNLAGRKAQLPGVEPDGFESVPGQGLRAEFARRTFVLGRRDFVEKTVPDSGIVASPAGNGDEDAEVYVAGPGLSGRFVFRDQVRPEAAGMLARLHEGNVHTVMLTGDRCSVAESLARELGIREVRSELLPEQKLAAVQALKDGGRRRVAMIGDGVNDAPGLAAADVSVAMGARGSDAALEQSAVILMNDRLENFLTAYDLSRRTESVIRQNLTVALGTVVIMVGASLFGVVPLALGVAAHEGSTVLVVINSLRLLFSGRGAAARPSSDRAIPLAASDSTISAAA